MHVFLSYTQCMLSKVILGKLQNVVFTKSRLVVMILTIHCDIKYVRKICYFNYSGSFSTLYIYI